MLLHKGAYYQSSIFASFPGITHGYSTRPLGDMRLSAPRESLYQLLGINSALVTRCEQIHGTRVGVIDAPTPTPVPLADGVMIGFPGAAAVLVGDCAPILLADPVGRRVAAVHAGWKGTLGNIMRSAIQAMGKAGSKPENISVSIGPRIGMCCYAVKKERAQQFLKLSGVDEKMISFWQDAWHVDIGSINYKQALSEGVLQKHIDIQPICTSCQNDTFFSYRKDAKETFGEIIGVIAVQ